MKTVDHLSELPLLPNQVDDMEGTADWAAGYLNEHELWMVMAAVADALVPWHAQGRAHGSVTAERVAVLPDRFCLLAPSKENIEARPEDDVWQTGALIYRLALGLEVFGGNGKCRQTSETPLPILRNEWADLSLCVKRMLGYVPDERPSMNQLAETAHAHLSNPWPTHPSLRPTLASADSSSPDWLEKYWPDEF